MYCVEWKLSKYQFMLVHEIRITVSLIQLAMTIDYFFMVSIFFYIDCLLLCFSFFYCIGYQLHLSYFFKDIIRVLTAKGELTKYKSGVEPTNYTQRRGETHVHTIR